jgi:hypothetical protein
VLDVQGARESQERGVGHVLRLGWPRESLWPSNESGDGERAWGERGGTRGARGESRKPQRRRKRGETRAARRARTDAGIAMPLSSKHGESSECSGSVCAPAATMLAASSGGARGGKPADQVLHTLTTLQPRRAPTPPHAPHTHHERPQLSAGQSEARGADGLSKVAATHNDTTHAGQRGSKRCLALPSAAN